MPELESQLAKNPLVYTKLLERIRPDQFGPVDMTYEGPFTPLYFKKTPEGTTQEYLLDQTERKNQSIFIEACDYMNFNDQERVSTALALMHYAHQNQPRESGERYSNHLLRVATTLARMHLDADTVIAGLLHDVLEDSEKYGFPVGSDFIETMFGSEINKLVLGCRNAQWDVKLEDKDVSDYEPGLPANKIDELKKIEYKKLTLKKVFRQFSSESDTDPRIIFIKLADRLDNMRELSGKDSNLKQMAKALETFEIYSEIAKAIGEYYLSRELTDLSFTKFYPSFAQNITEVIYHSSNRESHEKYDEKDLFRQVKIIQAMDRIFHINQISDIFNKQVRPELNGLVIGSTEILIPGIHDLFKNWQNKTDKKPFGSEDLFINVVIPVTNSIFDSDLHWKEITPVLDKHKFTPLNNSNTNHKKERLFQDENGKLHKVIIIPQREIEIKGRLADLYNYSLGNNIDSQLSFAIISNKNRAVQMLLRLDEHYQMLNRGGIESDDLIKSFARDIGGIRVRGTDKRDFVPLREGATVMEYAQKIRKERIVNISSFRLNRVKYGIESLNMVLNEGDVIEVRFNGDEKEVSPVWLTGQSDPDVMKILSARIRKNLATLKKTNDNKYLAWEYALQDMGMDRLKKFMKYNFIEALDQAKGYMEILKHETIESFLEAAAFHEISDFNLSIIAEEVDSFAQNHLSLDYDYPSDSNQQKIFRGICRKLGIQFSVLRIFEDKDTHFVRYYLPLEEMNKLTKLFNELLKYDFDHDSIFISALFLNSAHLTNKSDQHLALLKSFGDIKDTAESQFHKFKWQYFAERKPGKTVKRIEKSRREDRKKRKRGPKTRGRGLHLEGDE